MTNEGTIKHNSITKQAVTNRNFPNARTILCWSALRNCSLSYVPIVRCIISRISLKGYFRCLKRCTCRSIWRVPFFCTENRCFFSRFIRLFSLSIETISGYSCICLTEWMDGKSIREHRIRFLSTRQRVAYALHAFEACQFFCTLYHDASLQLSWYHRDFPPPNNLSVQ